MCTVSFIHTGNDAFVLTSSRDESPQRDALKPAEYSVLDTRMIFPKDRLSGGTWIGASDQHRVVCLLNGGYEKHTRLPEYRHSRGVVVKDFLSSTDIVKTVETYNLELIEPFTIVIVDWNTSLQLYELVWDGSEKHFQTLPLTMPHIWSSSMLYTEKMKQLRRDWFLDFQKEKELQANTLLNFHKTAGIGDSTIDVMMDRKFVKTTSITQIEKKEDLITMRYHDLATDDESVISFNLTREMHE